MKKLSVLHGWLALLIAIVVGAGCGGTGGGGTNTLPDPTVRFINAVSDVNGMDFYLNDTKTAPNVPYLGSTADFQKVDFITEEDGAYDISVNAAGTDNELERDYYLFQRDSHTLVIAYGRETFGTEPDKRVLQLILPINRTPASGQARLLIFNALTREDGIENGAIDLQTIDPNNPASQENPQFKKLNVNYGTFSEDANVLDIDAGTQTLQIKQAQSESIVIYAQKAFALEKGKIYFAMISGQVDSAVVAQQPVLTLIEIQPIL